jgi:hypothetical protein
MKSVSLIVEEAGDISRGIFDENPMSDCVLSLVNMLAYLRQRGLCVGQRQQVVEIGRAVRRPSEMLRDQRRLVALDEGAESSEMGRVKRLRTADRHAYAVQRDRMVAADSFEGPMRRAAGAHVVLGMHLEEARLWFFSQNRVQMLVPEAGSGEARGGQRWEAETTIRANVPYPRDGVHWSSPLPANRWLRSG